MDDFWLPNASQQPFDSLQERAWASLNAEGPWRDFVAAVAADPAAPLPAMD